MSSRFKNYLIPDLFIFLVFYLSLPSVGFSQYVPGEVIVQFTQGTKGSQAIAEAGKTSPLNLQALIPIIACLQSQTNVPLKPTQIISGERVVLSVNNDALITRILEQFSHRENVKKVEVLPPDSQQKKRFPLPPTILFEFTPTSSEFATLHQQRDIEYDQNFTDLISKLEQVVDLPLKGTFHSRGSLLVQINLQKLTLILVDRLQSLPDIQSAQPNYIATFR